MVREFREKLGDVIGDGVFRAALYTAGVIRKTVYSVFRVRTGSLARSFNATFIGKRDGGFSAGVYSDLVYAGVQEVGGTIYPKRKYLAIPLPSANIPIGKWPRHFTDLFLIKSKAGNLILAQKGGKGKIRPMFVLKQQVYVPPKGYIEQSAEEAGPEIERIISQAVAQRLKGG